MSNLLGRDGARFYFGAVAMVIAPACGGNISTVSPAPAAPVISTSHLEAQAGGQPAAGLWATSEMSRVTVSKAGMGRPLFAARPGPTLNLPAGVVAT